MSERFTLANRDHLETFVGVLFAMGALCPKCGTSTRVTSKNWRRCKECGERVARRDLPLPVLPTEQQTESEQ